LVKKYEAGLKNVKWSSSKHPLNGVDVFEMTILLKMFR
jgi:hypothetical protein